MLLQIPDVLNAQQVAQMRARLGAATWIDGNVTSGHQSAQAKYNEQIPEDGPEARELGATVVNALQASPLFFSAALPRQIFPPLFNRYRQGMKFASHVDNAIRTHAPTRTRIRTDLSATLFLSRPEEYDGGELLIEDTYGVQRVKLNAGSLVLYPATSLHRVEPITRGERIASFFWIESMVRDDAQRTILFDLDMSIVRLTAAHPGEASLVGLVGVYHNLLRMWADA
jgi:PKHD-type hydroxylase